MSSNFRLLMRIKQLWIGNLYQDYLEGFCLRGEGSGASSGHEILLEWVKEAAEVRRSDERMLSEAMEQLEIVSQ